MSNDEYQHQKEWEDLFKMAEEADKNNPNPREFYLIMSYDQMIEFEKKFKKALNKTIKNGK